MADAGQSLNFLTHFCRSCGAGLDRRARFCSACRASVIPGEAPAASVGTGVLADLEYIGFWIRLAATLIDDLIFS